MFLAHVKLKTDYPPTDARETVNMHKNLYTKYCKVWAIKMCKSFNKSPDV